MFDVSTTGGFVFFLLVLCAGYVARGDLSNTKKGEIEKFIIYTLWGFGVNLVTLLLARWIPGLLDTLNENWKIAAKLSTDLSGLPSFSITIIIFSLSYFFLLLVIAWGVKKITTPFLSKRKRY